MPTYSALAKMEEHARTAGPALFSPEGVLEQVRRLVKVSPFGENVSRITCVPKPDTLRVPWQYSYDTRADFDTFDMKTTFSELG